MSWTHTDRSTAGSHHVARAAVWVLVVVCALAGSALAGKEDEKNNLKARNAKPAANKHKDYVRVKVHGSGPPVKLLSTKVPTKALDSRTIQALVDKVVLHVLNTGVIKAPTGKKRESRRHLKWLLRRKKGLEPAAGGSRAKTTLLERLAGSLGFGQPLALAAVLEPHGDVAAFCERVYVLERSSAKSLMRRQKPGRVSKPVPEPALDTTLKLERIGNDGLPHYTVAVTEAEAPLLASFFKALGAMGRQCMPILRNGKLVASGTLAYLVRPFYKGQLQRVADWFMQQLATFKKDGRVTQDTLKWGAKFLAHPLAFFVDGQDKVRLTGLIKGLIDQIKWKDPLTTAGAS